jgi:hypothetical protein
MAGYTAAKLGARLDRSSWGETRDAADLGAGHALVRRVRRRAGPPVRVNGWHDVLITESSDVPVAAAQLLGHDVAATIGAERLAELLERWPGDVQLLVREFGFTGATWPRDVTRRRALIDALTRGLTDRMGEATGHDLAIVRAGRTHHSAFAHPIRPRSSVRFRLVAFEQSVDRAVSGGRGRIGDHDRVPAPGLA